MKEINGTITLAFVEEDNRQRIIFRVIPLCTREGSTFHGGAEEFPDEGSLRIVPDKREQSTFKERMREINGLCVITLNSDGKELMKVRQNRNYAPDQGEKNQFAIYSDVVCEFNEDGCFEVVQSLNDAASAMTARVLIQKDKMLYGPVAKQEAQSMSMDSLKPFGNDRYLLHTIEAPQVGKHLICWDPEATLNWRQRRNSLRRRDRGNAPAEENVEVKTEAPVAAESKKAEEKPRREKAEKPLKKADNQPKAEEKPEKTEKAEKPEKTEKPEKQRKPEKQHKTEEKPAPKAEEKETEALPIGTHLDILDSALPFEQQISRLAQPLSETANRLTGDTAPVVEEEIPEVVAHFNGTPLTKNSGKPIRIKTKPENVHQVVEQQLAGQRSETMASEMGAGAYGMIANPIENLRMCMEYVWQNADMRDQALEMLLGNEAFTADVATALRQGGMNLQAAAAAQEQLAEIEAERISLLMELEQAKESNKKFREQIVASVAQKKRDEVERLKNEVKHLEATCKKLSETAKTISQSNAKQLSDFVSAKLTGMASTDGERVTLSPVIGHEYTRHELAEQLRVRLNERGFSINEDEAMSLLISFALYDCVCLKARTMQDARAFADTILESFGLQSVSAVVHQGAHVEVFSLLEEKASRTPTVTVQPYGTEAIAVYGHKTIYLADESMISSNEETLMPIPVIQTPAALLSTFGRPEEREMMAPAALSAFAHIRSDSHPMLSEAEKWFSDLKRALSQEEVVVPEALYACMRRFIEVATRKVRGGFLAAADTAVCHWIVPLLMLKKCESAQVVSALAGLPRTLEQLGVR
ncbi:MAG: hypothetical protein J6K55_16185 [Clostridia bacterium]|nr:hypothetical protein [Clostridia bacterium]